MGFCIFLSRKRNSHTRQGPEDTYFSSSGRQKSLPTLCFTVSIMLYFVLRKQFPYFCHRAIKASEDLRGSTYVWGPQHSHHEVCHWNPPKSCNQRKSHWSWWVTALRQSSVGLNSEMLKDSSNPQIRCLRILCIFYGLTGGMKVVTSVRWTSIWLSSHTSRDILLCCNSWLQDICDMFWLELTGLISYKECCRNCILERYNRALPKSFILAVYSSRTTFTLWTSGLFQQTPHSPFPTTVAPPFCPHVTADSQASYTTGLPPVIQHSLNTQPEHTSAREPLAKQPQRLPYFHSVAQQTPCS